MINTYKIAYFSNRLFMTLKHSDQETLLKTLGEAEDYIRANSFWFRRKYRKLLVDNLIKGPARPNNKRLLDTLQSYSNGEGIELEFVEEK